MAPLHAMTMVYTAISFIASTVYAKLDTPTLKKGEWRILDKELMVLLQPLHYHLGRATNENDVFKVGSLCSETIAKFVKSTQELFEKAEVKPKTKFVKH